jgi:outer membrane receptor protein involved in Fe transport
VASGYRPGGPNAGVFGVGTPITYAADKTVNYEAGLNAEAFDKRLTFTGSVYYVHWSDIQLGSVDPTTGFLYFQNAKTASSKGIELSVNGRPWTGANATLSATLGKAELTSEIPSTAALGHPGDRLPNTPEATLSLDFEQTFPVAASLNGFVGGGANYVGSRVGPFQGGPVQQTDGSFLDQIRYPMAAYVLGSLRTGLRTTDGWAGTLYVSNLGNSRAILSGQTRGFTSAPGAPFEATILQPRTFGVSLTKTF